MKIRVIDDQCTACGHLLADGKSNQEIADELVLALNTVKKHVANILGKLGVSNRTQAVMAAKERDWL